MFPKFYFHYFLPNFCSNFFFRRLYPRWLLVYRDKTDSLCMCVMKIMICSKRSKLGFRLMWCLEYSYSAYTAHITLDVKRPISSPCCIYCYIYIFLESAIFNWSTQMSFRWHLIAECIKFRLDLRTRLFFCTMKVRPV